MLKKVLLGCAVPLLIVCVLAAFAARALLRQTPKPERSETVGRGDVEIKVIETGQIEPLRKVEVKSKVGGRLLRLFVDEGASVRQGQILATIDPQEVNSQVNALRAQLAAAQARVAGARTNAGFQQVQTSNGIDQYVQALAAAKARLDSAQVEAGAQPTLTRESIDIAQSNLDAARAQLKAQQDSLNLMVQSTHPNNVVSAQAAYDQARAQYQNAQRILTRQKQLLGRGFVSQQAVDSAQADADVAQTRVTDTKARLDRIAQTQALEAENLRSQVLAAQGQVRQAQATLEQARSTVLPTTKRRDLDSARAAYAQAKSQLAQARANRAQDQIRGSDAIAAQADAQQIQQQLNERLVSQADTTLYAPMSGVVTRRYAEVGDLIASAISSFSSGTPVYQVADTATMLVKLNVNEVDINKVRVGLPAEVTIDAGKGAQFAGRVRKVSPSAQGDSSSSSSGISASSTQSVVRFPVEVQVAGDTRQGVLRPGMSARCTIIVSRRKNVLRLPVNCVQGDPAHGKVQIVTSVQQNGQAIEKTAPRDVMVGLRGDDWIEIVDGVREGERVRPNPFTGPARKGVEFGRD